MLTHTDIGTDRQANRQTQSYTLTHSHIHIHTHTHTHTHTPERNTHSHFLLSCGVRSENDLQGAGTDLVEVAVQDAGVEKRRGLHQAEKADIVVGVQG